MTINLTKNTTYKAIVELGFIDKLASNEQVQKKFESVGFTNVVSEGSGRIRTVSGVWGKESQPATVPNQIKSIEEHRE